MSDILNTQVQNNILETRDSKEVYKKNQKHAVYSSENAKPRVVEQEEVVVALAITATPSTHQLIP